MAAKWWNGRMAEWSNGEDGRMADGMAEWRPNGGMAAEWRNGRMAVMATRMAGMSTYLLFYGTRQQRHQRRHLLIFYSIECFRKTTNFSVFIAFFNSRNHLNKPLLFTMQIAKPHSRCDFGPSRAGFFVMCVIRGWLCTQTVLEAQALVTLIQKRPFRLLKALVQIYFYTRLI